MITLLVQILQLSINGNCCEIEAIKRSDVDGGSTQQQRNEEHQLFCKDAITVVAANILSLISEDH